MGLYRCDESFRIRFHGVECGLKVEWVASMEALSAYCGSSDSEGGEDTLDSDRSGGTSEKRICDEEKDPKDRIPEKKGGSRVMQPSVHPLRTHDQPLDFSNLRGYVSKRKRHLDGGHGVQEGSDAAAVSTELQTVSQYFSQFASSSKRMKQGAKIPKNRSGTFRGHSRPILSLEWHPNDSRLLLSASLDGKLKLWDVTERKVCIATYSFHEGAVRDVEWVSSNTVVSGGFDNSARYSDIEKGRTIVALKHQGFVTAVKVHPDNSNVIITGDSRTNIKTWDLRSGEKVAQYIGAGGKILDIVFLQSKKQFAASSDIVRKNAADQALSVWDISSTVLVSNQIYLEPFTCPCLRVHPTDSTFMAQSNGNYVVLFSSTKPYKLNKHKRFEGHAVQGHDVGFDISPDGTLVCSASANGGIYIYDYYSAELVHHLSLSLFPSLSAAWHPLLTSTIAASDWNAQIHLIQ